MSLQKRYITKDSIKISLYATTKKLQYLPYKNMYYILLFFICSCNKKKQIYTLITIASINIYIGICLSKIFVILYDNLKKTVVLVYSFVLKHIHFSKALNSRVTFLNSHCFVFNEYFAFFVWAFMWIHLHIHAFR